jgi:hypothetical protein
MPVRVALQISGDLFRPIAVLDRIPKSEINGVWPGVGGSRQGPRFPGRWNVGNILPRLGERSEGALRIMLQIGGKLVRAAVPDTVPKSKL